MHPIKRKKRVGFTFTEFDIGITNTVTKRKVRISCPRADSVEASIAFTTESVKERGIEVNASGNKDNCDAFVFLIDDDLVVDVINVFS